MKQMLSDVVTSNTIKKIRKEKVQRLISNSIINQKLKIHYPMKTSYHFNVPPNLFQTWHTKELPPLMFNSVAKLRQSNPRFNYVLFDDNDCYEFIKNNFENDVLNAYSI
jgi:mannosyltransferase OCH1-like enzyme